MAVGGRRRTGRQRPQRAEPTKGRRAEDPDRPAPAELERVLAPVLVGRAAVLEKIEVVGAGRRPVVRVTVDRDDGPGALEADELADISRAISDALDRADPIPGEYLLEVSTPGVSRPLTEARHWRRAVGHLVTVRTRDGRRLTGRVCALAANGVVGLASADGRVVELDLDDVDRARMVVEFTAVPDRDEGTADGRKRGGNDHPTEPGRGVHGGH